MTTKLLAVLVAAVSFSSITNAASITPHSGVSILYINGQSAEDKMGRNELDEGFNQVIVRMDKDMSRGSSSDIFTSKPYVLNLENVQGDVAINHPQTRSMMEAKKAFNGNQPKWVVEQDGKAMSYKQEVLESKSGLFPYLGMDKLVAEHNQSRGIYFNNGQVMDKPVAVQTAVTSSSSTSEVATQAAVTTNTEQLKAWYLKSSPEERKAFRKWIIDQE